MSFRGFSHSTTRILVVESVWRSMCSMFTVQSSILCCALSGDCVEYLCILQYVCAVKAVLTLAGRGGHYLSFPRDLITSVSSDRRHLPISGRLPHFKLLPFRKIHVWALPDYLLEPESSRLKQFQNAILHPHVNFNITIVTFFLLFRKHRKRPTLIWKHYVDTCWFGFGVHIPMGPDTLSSVSRW